MRKCGIVGRGFGLYGYLPALMHRGCAVWTLEAYRERIRNRADLRDFETAIAFVPTLDDLFAQTDMLVLAVRPADQEALVGALLQRGWRGTLMLEKPVACTPEVAADLLARLHLAGIDYRIGFTVLVTDWSARMEAAVASAPHDHLKIDFRWRFHAHHYRHGLDTWKRYPSQGGGALNFYGIHLIALLARYGRWRVDRCRRIRDAAEGESGFAFALVDGRRRATVQCDTAATHDSHFEITADSNRCRVFAASLDNPFAEGLLREGTFERARDIDVRSVYTGRILDESAAPAVRHAHYMEHVQLWGRLAAAARGQWGSINPPPRLS